MDSATTLALAALISVAIGLIGAFLSARKLKAEISEKESNTAESMSQSASVLIAPYRQEVEILRAQLGELYKRVDGQERDIVILKKENSGLQARVDEQEREIVLLRQEKASLERRVAELEKENSTLREGKVGIH